MNYLIFLKEKIKNKFKTIYLDIYDETHKHRYNFNKICIKIIIASNDFINKTLLKRHQEIYDVLLKNKITNIHAIEIYAYTNLEWNAKIKKEYLTVKCLQK